MYLTNSQFWVETAERAVKTAAQTAAALIGNEAVNIIELDWVQMAGIVATAVVLSVLTSLASDRVGTPGPSLVTPAPETPETAAVPPTGGAVNNIAAAHDPANQAPAPGGEL